jgi:GT2 family glycosyltransferase
VESVRVPAGHLPEAMTVPRGLVERLHAWHLRLMGVTGLAPWASSGFPDYYAWRFAANERVDAARRRALRRRIAAWRSPPTISVVMAVADPPPRLLLRAIGSVLSQVYPRWELRVAATPATGSGARRAIAAAALLHPRVRRVRRFPDAGGRGAALDAAVAACSGEFVAVLGEADELSPGALFAIAEAAARCPGAALLHSDEDLLTAAGRRHAPRFEPDFNYELLLGGEPPGGLRAWRRSLVLDAGGFGPGPSGAEELDLALRFLERVAPSRIVHLPRVLYGRRTRGGVADGPDAPAPQVAAARVRAVQAHLDRTAPGAVAEAHAQAAGRCRVRFPVPDPAPRVSIVVPTRNALPLLRGCLETLFERTRYAPYDVVVVDNGSDDPEALAYLAGLAQAGRVSVVRDDGPFNFAALCNRGVAASTGEYVLLLNNDMEVIDPGWLAEMVSVAARPGVGAVGARLWFPDRTLQHAGVVLGLGGVAGHVHVGLPAGEPGYFGRAVLLQAVSAVTAACLLVRRKLYDEVGGLDGRNLAVAYNDVDFCLRLLRAGHRNVWTPHAELVHHESASRGQDLTPANAGRLEAEARYLRETWGELLAHDPAFNVNLSLEHAGVEMLDAPRP